MKKVLSLLCIVFCFALIFSFAACRNKKENQNNETVNGTTIAETDPEKIKKNKTIKLELPLNLIDEKYRDDLDAYCEANGFISAKLNKKSQTVTIKMKSFSHELLLSNIGLSVIKEINSVASSKKYASVKKIKSIDTDNFDKVTIAVDKNKYKKEGDIGAYVIGQSCLLYQLYSGAKDCSCSVVVTDNKTGKTIETKTYTNKD